MFSREQMQRAIEDALKSMEGIALELYRRGREEAREELEEARARNADMRTMLEQVTRERDEARADAERYLADLRRCASEPYEHAKERDEAFRRGAAAMREHCIGMACAQDLDLDAQDRMEERLRALPIPEEP